MSDLEIVEGDLEKLSSSIGDVAATMAGVDLPTAMTHVPAAIPGATSASLASSATTARTPAATRSKSATRTSVRT